MPIDNRELAPGAKLEGTHKKTSYICEVVATPEGEIRFKLEDGRLFTSPSSAGKAVMNGVSCNGWRFWSLADEARREQDNSPAGENDSSRKPTTAKRVRQIKKLPNQKGAEEGQTRWFCSGCMKGFLMPTGQEPAACPEGHPWEQVG
jgi:hypothetical protein